MWYESNLLFLVKKKKKKKNRFLNFKYRWTSICVSSADKYDMLDLGVSIRVSVSGSCRVEVGVFD